MLKILPCSVLLHARRYEIPTRWPGKATLVEEAQDDREMIPYFIITNIRPKCVF